MRFLRRPATRMPAPAAISIPQALISRLPVIGRASRRRIEQQQRARAAQREPLRRQILRLPIRALSWAGLRKASEPPLRRLSIPFVSPMVHRVREPIERTARVVKVARQARLPKSRWERLREAAELALRDPVGALHWERLMGLGMAFATRESIAQAPRPPRSRLARLVRPAEPAAVVERGIRARLLAHLLPGRLTPRKTKKAGPVKPGRPRKTR